MFVIFIFIFAIIIITGTYIIIDAQLIRYRAPNTKRLGMQKGGYNSI